MIRKHNFNSQWLNYEVGFLADPEGFFSLSKVEQQKALSSYQWVELRTSKMSSSAMRKLYFSGFWYVDTQVNFTLDLRNISNRIIPDTLRFERASEYPFIIQKEDICSFKKERFIALPGVNQEMIDERYISIANALINAYPDCCLRIIDGDSTQGWYFGTPEKDAIDLTLAMLHKDAHIRGKQLYQKALSVYAQNFLVSSARFSVNNVPVHNILLSVGARFLQPESVWFWTSHSDAIAETA